MVVWHNRDYLIKIPLVTKLPAMRKDYNYCSPWRSLTWWRHQVETLSRYWHFVRGIHRSPVHSLTKASDAEIWCFLWSAPWINGWVNNREAGDLKRHRAHHDAIVTDKKQSSTKYHNIYGKPGSLDNAMITPHCLLSYHNQNGMIHFKTIE